MRNPYKILVGKSEWKRIFRDLGVDERIILVWILWEWIGKLWTAFINSEYEPVADCSEYSGSIKEGNFSTE
jgi:hypothetical protein